MTVAFEDPPPLPAWLSRALPYGRRAARVDGRRMTFLDEGAGRPVLMVHGNPTWSFLWRKVIAALEGRGLRSVAPDLFGFGGSYKPRRPGDHRLELHVDAVAQLVEALDLRGVVLVGQDWGGPIAMGVGERLRERVHGIVLANTAALRPARPFRPKAFHRFSRWPIVSDLIFRGLGFPLQALQRAQGDRESIGSLERRAYRYPLRRARDRAGPLGLARMVPAAEGDEATGTLDRIGAWVEGFRGPAALVWGVRDPILGRALRRHRAALPQAEVTETQAGHFLQEEVPEALARAIAGVAARSG